MHWKQTNEIDKYYSPSPKVEGHAEHFVSLLENARREWNTEKCQVLMLSSALVKWPNTLLLARASMQEDHKTPTITSEATIMSHLEGSIQKYIQGDLDYYFTGCHTPLLKSAEGSVKSDLQRVKSMPFTGTLSPRICRTLLTRELQLAVWTASRRITRVRAVNGRLRQPLAGVSAHSFHI
jgi:hypothetical protein